MVRESVSQVTLGQARLMFWRDTMKDVYNVGDNFLHTTINLTVSAIE